MLPPIALSDYHGEEVFARTSNVDQPTSTGLEAGPAPHQYSGCDRSRSALELLKKREEVELHTNEGLRPAFPQNRSARRAAAQALGTLASFGRRTLSRAIWALGRQQQDWSADYRLHARSEWTPGRLFQPIVENALPFCGGRYVVAAIDDTRLHKTGRHIQSAFYQRDPLSPKFRFNLMFGLRFLQISLLVPLYRKQKASARALPVRFEEVPALKHPARKAPLGAMGRLAAGGEEE